MELAGGPVAVLLNCHFPIVGFAVPPSDGDISPLQFVDCDGLANVLKATGQYEVVSREQLERALGPQELEQWQPAEIKQAKHW